MTRAEKNKLKKESKRYYQYSNIVIGIWILGFIIVFSSQTIGDTIRELIHDNIVNTVIYISFILTLPFVGLFFSTKARWRESDVQSYRLDLLDEKNKLHLKLFWDRIQSGDYEEAKRLYNIDGYIIGSERVLCNGVLMGIAKVTGIDKNWKEKVDERMADYC